MLKIQTLQEEKPKQKLKQQRVHVVNCIIKLVLIKIIQL